MAAHRIGARVAGLSPAQLCAIIEAQASASDAALRVAEEHAARLVEQPEWILSEVLLSPDLAPHILAQLPTKEHAVKGTCRAWRRGWKQTLVNRERPRLLVFGGNGNGGNLSSMERYDPSTNEWEEEAVESMPTAREDAGMAVLDGKLYAAGGLEGGQDGGAFSNLVERYDLSANAWEAVAPMAEARYAPGMAVLDDKLYAVGGYNDGHLSSVERYDPAVGAWEAVAQMARARNSHAVAVLDGKLYAVGGCNNDDGYLTSVERYDPAANAWEAVAPLATAREQSGAAVLDGAIYVVAGCNDDHVDPLSSVERYDPAVNEWEEVAPVSTARDRLGAAVL